MTYFLKNKRTDHPLKEKELERDLVILSEGQNSQGEGT